MTHPIGCAVMKDFTECVRAVDWHAFSAIHNTWDYVHNTTKDYSIIARIGFEDTEPDAIVVNPSGGKFSQPWGDPWPISNQDCNEPTIIVEYTRNRLKNGFFIFRQYLDADPANDLPSHWTLRAKPPNYAVGLTSNSYKGPWTLYVKSNGAKGTLWFSQTCEVLPDTEYVLSWYFRGTVPLWEAVNVAVIIGTFEKWFYLDPGEYQDWTNFELRFRTPTTATSATICFFVIGSEQTFEALFDAFWLSECPVTFTPHYRLTAQLEDYKGERQADIYFNGNLIWQNVSAANVPHDIFETNVSLDGIPAFRSAIRHSVQNNVFYYRYSSMHPDWQNRANMLQAWRDRYGFTTDIYHVLWRESDNYPDDYMVSWESVHDCDAWFTQPRTRTFYPYHSKMCLCRAASNSPTCGYFLAGWFRAITGMHVLNKYGDPYKTINIPGTTCAEGISYKAALDAFTRVIPKLTWNKGLNVNYPASPPLYPPYANAICLAFLAELGYGFQDVLEAHGDGAKAEEARKWADNLASTVLKQQWGYPFEASKPGFYKHESYGDVNIPEFTGGFCTLIVYKDDEPLATSREEWFAKLVDMYNMPMETPGMIPVNQESTFCSLRGLQIYEWYKFKGGKGAFPKLLMPADVDGDGWVSDLDVAKVQFCISNGFYDPLCDINIDGVIDEKDLNLVKANLGRGEPRLGAMWTPALSSSVPVKVSV
jgi:hypothetical protein